MSAPDMSGEQWKMNSDGTGFLHADDEYAGNGLNYGQLRLQQSLSPQPGGGPAYNPNAPEGDMMNPNTQAQTLAAINTAQADYNSKAPEVASLIQGYVEAQKKGPGRDQSLINRRASASATTKNDALLTYINRSS